MFLDPGSFCAACMVCSARQLIVCLVCLCTSLCTQDSVELGVPGALELWLAEDHARMEPKLTQREPVQQLVALYARVAQVWIAHGIRTPVHSGTNLAQSLC